MLFIELRYNVYECIDFQEIPLKRLKFPINFLLSVISKHASLINHIDRKLMENAEQDTNIS